ncbi:MAG TPA: hypothetical protein VM582_04225, partial [Candidatus Thermoplasmatota archaeon]|nr:hypothetical protein [Candidatus Thermoplasmatota archaeon]
MRVGSSVGVVVRHAQREHIRELWPDKLLYGSVMIFVTGIVGVLHAALVLAFDITYSKNVPPLLRGWPAEATLALSAVALVCGIVAIRRLSIRWGMAGAIAGFFSLALLGLASLFALVAAAFLLVAHREEEHRSDHTRQLGAEHWPDKSLAASLLLLMGGFVTLAWGGAVLAGLVNFGGGLAPTLGALEIVAGLLALVAAYFLYHQREERA